VAEPAQTPEVVARLPLHALEFEILLSLAEEVMHAYRIVQGIEARQPSWSTILPTNLYRRIRRLAADGLIEEVDHDEPGGRPRKYFTITELGRSVARAEAGRLRRLLGQAERGGMVPAGDGR
jgi:DNA-binding PadR family transcriptional regulator